MSPPSSLVRHLPTASKFSSARPSGSITEWQVEQVEGDRCSDRRARSVVAFLPLSSLSFSAGTFGGGAGGGVPMMVSRMYLPRFTGDVRFDSDVTVRKLPWPRMP